MKVLRLFCVLALLAAPLAASASGSPTQARAAAQAEGPPGSFELVGHSPLMDRGMNAALAVRGDYAYVGSRTDGKEGNANNAGVLVVDIKDPSKPEVVHQIGPPHEGNTGETSREMRIWPEKNLLIVMNLFSNCSELIHGCTPVSGDDNFRFYDIAGANAKEPKFLGEYKPSVNPHEFYLWDDPKKPGRALMFMSTPAGPSQLLVADISNARDKGKVVELGKATFGADDSLHSLSVTHDGKLAYLANLTAGVLMADVSEFSEGKPKPEARVLTPPKNAPKWEGPGPHSAVPIFGTKFALITDEVYGEALRALGHGCPWGWVRTLFVGDPVRPKVAGEFKLLPYNDESYCTSSEPRPNSSFSAHNPTLTKNLAFITWHSGGLQALDLSDPAKPTQAAEFLPTPLPVVLQEDPALSAGEDKVVMWSFPVIQKGLIHVVDIRNGYYILRYKGSFSSEVTGTSFLEGNSNLGDTAKLSGGTSGGGGGTTPTRQCTIIGSTKGNVIQGTDGADVICGRGGNDKIDGRRGNDVIRGGRGADRLSGGRGRDFLRGGAGRDTCIGGPGRDRFRSCRRLP